MKAYQSRWIWLHMHVGQLHLHVRMWRAKHDVTAWQNAASGAIGQFLRQVISLKTFPRRAVIRQDLNLTRSGVSGANVASVCGAIFARISMGTFTDAFGPRMGFSGLLTLSSSAGASQPSSTTSAPWCSCWYTSHATILASLLFLAPS